MPIMKRLRTLPVPATVLAALAVSSSAQAGNAMVHSQILDEAIQTRFEPSRQETRVAGRVSPKLCFSFQLPQEWRARMDGPKAKLESVVSGAEIEVGLRSAQDLKHLPQPDLASRDAAFLQQGYEDLLGRPAQSVTLAASSAGATRWSATWIDAHLPTASHAMTIETFIVPMSGDWILELSLTDIDAREAYDNLARMLLTGLEIRSGAACGG